MPKLTPKTLEKRFPCNCCEETFRTRQGLSGHYQFKHKTNQKPNVLDSINIVTKASELKLAAIKIGLSNLESARLAKLMLSWGKIQVILEQLHMGVTSQDYKNYLITSLSLMYKDENT